MQPQPIRRIVVDVSTVARWTGPPVGIVRVEHELATRVQASHQGSVLCFWDGNAGQFRTLNPRWASSILSWRGTIDPHQPAPHQRRIRSLLSFRHPIIMALERFRLSTPSPLRARLADRLQRAVLALRRHSFPLEDRRGHRLACVARHWALGEALSLTQADVVLLAGTDWYHTDPAAIGALKRRLGFRLAVICYDLIPFLFPTLFPATDLAMVRRYWSEVLPNADVVICNSRVVEADVRAVAAAQGISVRATAVAPLGFELPTVGDAQAGLPDGIAPGRYVLFVSTIEPRKGHALLLDVWQRLLARGIPQRHGFHMVFVGRPGWKVPCWDLDTVLQRIDAASGGGMLLHLQGISDAELDALYRNAAFCVYPSLYEGFGLPIIEAFARGKAVIASTGGAVPETAGDLAPCLDPADAAAWEEMLADWIEHPERQAAYEQRIRAGFAHPNWAEAATNILTIAQNLSRCAGEVETRSVEGEGDRAAP